jgi:hypothetical protein
MVHEVWGQKDHPSGLDRNTVRILALSFHTTCHHAPTRASFHPKTRQEDFLYDTKLSWGLKSIFGEGWFSTFLAPLLLIFSEGNGPKWSIWPSTAPFCPIFVAVIFFIEM